MFVIAEYDASAGTSSPLFASDGEHAMVPVGTASRSRGV